MSSKQQRNPGTPGRAARRGSSRRLPDGMAGQHQQQMGTSKPPDEASEWKKRAEGLLNSLPQPSIQPLPLKHAYDLSRYQNKLSCTPEEALQKCADVMRGCDADSCKAYREEIDTLLVFAGLFSAVVTPFTVESYQWLQRDPNDAIISLLSQLVAQSGQLVAQSGNHSQAPPIPAGLPDAVSARINVYWFLSLTLSLAAALLASLCKQWVREFEQHGVQSHAQHISVRQSKLEGFERWGVAAIVATIPLLLQSALGLFAVGVVELLWKLHTVVAVVVLIPTLAAAIFYAATTLLPGLQLVCSPFGLLRELSQCPFKSPQALLVLRMHILLSNSLWCPFRDPCPRLVCSSFEFCYRKCLVVCRRVRASFRPENPLNLPARARGPARGLFHRIVHPWRRDESEFYNRTVDRLELGSFTLWCRRHVRFPPCWRRSTGSHPPHRYRIERKCCGSWITLDREFTRLRDATIKRDVVSPMACFRGLSWLLENTDRSGLREWIWLAVWDISLHYGEQGPHHMQLHHIHDGVVYLTSGAAENMDRNTQNPLLPVLAYAKHAKLDASFMGELFIHLLPFIDDSVAGDLRLPGRDNDGIWYSGLHAVMNNLLRGPQGSTKALISLAIQQRVLWLVSLSQQELACLIALHFYTRLSEHEDVFDGGSDSQLLFATALDCLVFDSWSPDASHEAKSMFSALAVAFDGWLEEHGTEDISEVLPTRLYDKEGLPVYLDLISSAPDELGTPSGGVAAAKARLARQLTHCLRREEERYLRDPYSGPGWGTVYQLTQAISSLTGQETASILDNEDVLVDARRRYDLSGRRERMVRITSSRGDVAENAGRR